MPANDIDKALSCAYNKRAVIIPRDVLCGGEYCEQFHMEESVDETSRLRNAPEKGGKLETPPQDPGPKTSSERP